MNALFRTLAGLVFAWGAAGALRAASPDGDGRWLEHVILPGATDRFARAEFTCWLPDPSRPVRAVIIHQHGCGNSSAAVNPPVTLDFHWRALARRHDCALIVPQYTVNGDCAEWNHPDSGSERALFAALHTFAGQAGRPEMATAPWLLWGHSGGSSWSAQMILRHPGRVLAASFRGGAHLQFGDADFRARFAAAARDLPLLFVWGRGETDPASRHHVSWDPMQSMYRELRAAGARVALAIDPRTEHHCGDSRLLVLPYYDAVLTARFAPAAAPEAWVEVASRDVVPVTADRRTDPAFAWLPSESVARQWRQFGATGKVTPARAPTRAPAVQATLGADGRDVAVRWRLEPELDGGLRRVKIFRDGKPWKEIGAKDAAFLATNRDSPPNGLHESSLRDTDAQPGARHRYEVSFLDHTGAESPRSEAAEIHIPTTAKAAQRP